MGIDTTLEYLAVAIGILLLLGGGLLGLLRGRGGGTKELPPQHRPPERPKGTTDHRSGTIVLDRPSDKATGEPAPTRERPAAPAPDRTAEAQDTEPVVAAPAEADEYVEPTDVDGAAAPSLPTEEEPRPGGSSVATGAVDVPDTAPTTGDTTPDVYRRDADVEPLVDTPTDTDAPAGTGAPADADVPADVVEADTAAAPGALPDLETLEPAEPEQPVETPAPTRDRMRALRTRLASSNTAIGKSLLAVLSSGKLTEEDWEDVEDTLLRADLGIEPTTELVESLRRHVSVDGTTDPEVAKDWLYADLLELVEPGMDRGLAASRVDGRPACLLVVGVNGTGKTTTVGKLARVLVANDRDVVLGAADTFRAAAADQLETWGARVGVPVVRSDRDGADPAAVAFDAVRTGAEMEADCVVIDTAGRLHNKVGLMDELSKIKRVVEKQQPIDEVLLVIDATTGQNGLAQAKVFAQAVDVTGVVLTKLDGTAKGGIVVAVQRQLGVPVKLVGLGEGPDDLAPFVPEAFVDAIVG